MGTIRKQWLSDSLTNLKSQLATLNIPFWFFKDYQMTSIESLRSQVEIQTMFVQNSPASEEHQHIQRCQQLLQPSSLKRVNFLPLLNTHHYPWLKTSLPDRYTDMRQLVEKKIIVDALLATISPQPMFQIEVKDDWDELVGWRNHHLLPMQSGETAALNHLQHYIFDKQYILTYKLTRNNMLQFEHSTKFSPYLANGNLSPRLIYWKIKEAENRFGANQSTYWVWFELLWRDYFYYLHLLHGDRFFYEDGIKSRHILWKHHPQYIEAIFQAKTGYPLVDANLTELYQTGWMSNRGRQNVASFMSKILGLDWRLGASLFEKDLLDYDVSSNYGNWQYVSGVGVDPREDRVFNISLQAKKYDAKGAYVHHFLPILGNIPAPLIYQPWTMNALEMSLYGCHIGRDYPAPIIVDKRVMLTN